MINLFSMKKKGSTTINKPTPAYLRVQRDITDLTLPPNCEITFPETDNIFKFTVKICPDEGFYVNGQFVFQFNVGPTYPHDPPKVKCLTKIFHPNIDMEGHVCLNILREEWNPVLNINSIIYGLQLLFLEPNADEALNREAGDLLLFSPTFFAAKVTRAMLGYSVDGCKYDHCLK